MKAIIEGLQNFWTGYSKSNERYYEKILIQEWSKIPLANIKIEDIPVSSTKDDTIHCISVAEGKKTPYVMLPGFASSGAMYYKLMEKLSTKFDLYYVDMRGMGGYSLLLLIVQEDQTL